MVKILVSGCCGRMGSRIASLAFNDSSFEVIGGVEKKGHAAIGLDLGEKLGFGRKHIIITSNIKEIISNSQVIIEFTTPETTLSHLEKALSYSKVVVIGTTGFSENEVSKIKEASKKIPIVFSPNMSVGVNVLFGIVESLTKSLSGYDVEILEAHHKFKKDSPSGTTNKILDIIANSRGEKPEKIAKYGRKGFTGERTSNEIGVHSIRAGDIVGSHTVIFAGDGEHLEISHHAHSRDAFAKGALKAAKFLVDRKLGLYDMFDVLGVKK